MTEETEQPWEAAHLWYLLIGMNDGEIGKQYSPPISANAARKRSARLIETRRAKNRVHLVAITATSNLESVNFEQWLKIIGAPHFNPLALSDEEILFMRYLAKGSKEQEIAAYYNRSEGWVRDMKRHIANVIGVPSKATVLVASLILSGIPLLDD